MTADIKWNIENLERDANTGVVKTVHWRVIATQENVMADAYGSVPLDEPEGDIIPFEELSKTTVLNWTKAKLPVQEIEEQLQKNLDVLLAPKVLPGVPWD